MSTIINVGVHDLTRTLQHLFYNKKRPPSASLDNNHSEVHINAIYLYQ